MKSLSNKKYCFEHKITGEKITVIAIDKIEALEKLHKKTSFPADFYVWWVTSTKIEEK